MKLLTLMAMAVVASTSWGAEPFFKCFAPNVGYDGWQEIRVEGEKGRQTLTHQVFGDIQKKGDIWWFVKPRPADPLADTLTCEQGKNKLLLSCQGNNGVNATTRLVKENYLAFLSGKGLVESEERNLRFIIDNGKDTKEIVFPQENCVSNAKYKLQK